MRNCSGCLFAAFSLGNASLLYTELKKEQQNIEEFSV